MWSIKKSSGLQDQRSAGAGYNLIDSVLLLYSSLVLIIGSSSWIQSASKVIRYPSPLEVEARCSIFFVNAKFHWDIAKHDI